MEQQQTPIRVLVAEDEAINRLYVVSLLEERGFSCTAVKNGREAVDAFRSGGASVMLIDIAMPVMGGLEAVREVRRLEAGAAVAACVVIVLSAHSEERDRADSLAAGVDLFLEKPFSEVDLLDAVEAAAASYRSRCAGR